MEIDKLQILNASKKKSFLFKIQLFVGMERLFCAIFRFAYFKKIGERKSSAVRGNEIFAFRMTSVVLGQSGWEHRQNFSSLKQFDFY